MGYCIFSLLVGLLFGACSARTTPGEWIHKVPEDGVGPMMISHHSHESAKYYKHRVMAVFDYDCLDAGNEFNEENKFQAQQDSVSSIEKHFPCLSQHKHHRQYHDSKQAFTYFSINDMDNDDYDTLDSSCVNDDSISFNYSDHCVSHFQHDSAFDLSQAGGFSRQTFIECNSEGPWQPFMYWMSMLTNIDANGVQIFPNYFAQTSGYSETTDCTQVTDFPVRFIEVDTPVFIENIAFSQPLPGGACDGFTGNQMAGCCYVSWLQGAAACYQTVTQPWGPTVTVDMGQNPPTGDLTGAADHGTKIAAILSSALYGTVRRTCLEVYGACVSDSATLELDGTCPFSEIEGAFSVLRTDVTDVQRTVVLTAMVASGLSASDVTTMQGHISTMISNGAVVVTAAGNHPSGDDSCFYYPGSTTPGAATVSANSFVITVSGHNYIRERYKDSNHGDCVDVWAGGSNDIYGALGTTVLAMEGPGSPDVISGTSLAAASVAGVIGNLLFANPQLDYDQLLAAMLSDSFSCNPLGNDAVNPVGCQTSAACPCVNYACSAISTFEVLTYGSTSNCDNDYLSKLTELGYTYTFASVGTGWSNMVQDDFERYQAFVVCDFNRNARATYLDPMVSNINEWAPLVNGNMIVIGTDEGSHGRPLFLQAGLEFILDGTSSIKTGMYFSMSEFYEVYSSPTPAPSTSALNVDVLGYWGVFAMVGSSSGRCHDDIEVVTSHPAVSISGVSDVGSYLSNWGCSSHESFTAYPADWTVLAVSENHPNTAASQTWPVPGGGTVTGLPYIIIRESVLSEVCSNEPELDPDTGRFIYETIGINRWNGGSMYGGEYVSVDGPCFDTLTTWDCFFDAVLSEMEFESITSSRCIVPEAKVNLVSSFGVVDGDGDIPNGLFVTSYEYDNIFEFGNTKSIYDVPDITVVVDGGAAEPKFNAWMAGMADALTLDWATGSFSANVDISVYEVLVDTTADPMYTHIRKGVLSSNIPNSGSLGFDLSGFTPDSAFAGNAGTGGYHTLVYFQVEDTGTGSGDISNTISLTLNSDADGFCSFFATTAGSGTTQNCPQQYPFTLNGCETPGWFRDDCQNENAVCSHYHGSSANCVIGSDATQCCYSASNALNAEGYDFAYSPIQCLAEHFIHDLYPLTVCCLESGNCGDYTTVRPTDGGGGVQTGCAGAFGDPHFETLDGYSSANGDIGYTFNGIGTFELLTTPEYTITVGLSNIFEDASQGCTGSVISSFGIHYLDGSDTTVEFVTDANGVAMFVNGEQILVPDEYIIALQGTPSPTAAVTPAPTNIFGQGGYSNPLPDDDDDDDSEDFSTFTHNDQIEITANDYTDWSVAFLDISLNLVLLVTEMDGAVGSNADLLSFFTYLLSVGDEFNGVDSTPVCSGLMGNFNEDATDDLIGSDGIDYSDGGAASFIEWHAFGLTWLVAENHPTFEFYQSWVPYVECLDEPGIDFSNCNAVDPSFEENARTVCGCTNPADTSDDDGCEVDCLFDAAASCNIEIAEETIEAAVVVEEAIVAHEESFDCINPCADEPCTCDEVMTGDNAGTCNICNYNSDGDSVNGCSQCNMGGGYFKKSDNHPCVLCSDFDENCNLCQDYNGCGQCKPGFARVLDEGICGLYYCILTPDPTHSPTPDPTANPTNQPTPSPTNNPTATQSGLCPVNTINHCSEDPNCGTCQPWGGCSSCDAGFWLWDYGYLCQTCSDIPNCQTCNDWSGCTNCIQGYQSWGSEVCDVGATTKNLRTCVAA